MSNVKQDMSIKVLTDNIKYYKDFLKEHVDQYK